MLLPTKHEILSKNDLVVGAEIIKLLSKNIDFNTEDLYDKIRKKESILLNQFYDILTFLWFADIVILDNYKVRLTK